MFYFTCNHGLRPVITTPSILFIVVVSVCVLCDVTRVMEDDSDEVDQTLLDSIILQVFEEQEERSGSLRYPLATQRHALDFVKLINRKGFPYVLMCQAIEEKQEKFRSWRLGNGNAYIGLLMMKRINKTVQVRVQYLYYTGIQYRIPPHAACKDQRIIMKSKIAGVDYE